MPEVDKVYVKKFKINDMLNDLFMALNENKPEHPVEFAIKHLENKLPPGRKVAASPSNVSGDEDGANLLAKMMGAKRNLLAGSENEALSNNPAAAASNGGQEGGDLVSKVFGNKNLLGNMISEKIENRSGPLGLMSNINPLVNLKIMVINMKT